VKKEEKQKVDRQDNPSATITVEEQQQKKDEKKEYRED